MEGADEPDDSSRNRILDAARDLFTAEGVEMTTMRQIALQSGVSRAWLYRQFASRDEVVQAVVLRETQRWTARVTAGHDRTQQVDEAVITTFVRVVRALRSDASARSVLLNLIPMVPLADSSPFITVMVRGLQKFLYARADLSADHATIAAESIIRLILSIGIAPIALWDFDNPVNIHAYANQVIPALIRQS
ncbi:TetR/AcrR family transcriptional regulator [Mycobacteroides salmoniphilum]|uniref:TetR/AcrR family transcriptional regulator n=1 Tax=Mycobacteroides salmoniphilum TaxID=404941 RepID=UPI0010CF5ED8|nr:TetR/AcrR family transcriptional regulator [Mycobacteroides salmoniphilum]TDZ76383.1 HTH-type transcriptional regulator SrpR [Mycobacteroides salmoniphilum]TDZ84901.1 HTH-type transcriptional regulator SrpR [Mycobacteroides salmoniphilum]